MSIYDEYLFEPKRTKSLNVSTSDFDQESSKVKDENKVLQEEIEELRKENEKLNEMNNALMKRIDNAVCALKSVHFDLKIKW